jgi:hypothetical protein
MQPWELNKIIKDTKYKTVGKDLDYQIAVIEQRPCLLFQESTDDQDWKFNFDWLPIKYAGHKMHRGFVKAWESGRDEILKDFIGLVSLYESKPLITGWSFGGAMSVIACEDFYLRTGIKADVITFGAPKVCANKETAESIREHADMFVQYAQPNDCVCLCPPVPGFRHVTKTTKVGDRFNLIKVFNPGVYHQEYDNKSIYKE